MYIHKDTHTNDVMDNRECWRMHTTQRDEPSVGVSVHVLWMVGMCATIVKRRAQPYKTIVTTKMVIS